MIRFRRRLLIGGGLLLLSSGGLASSIEDRLTGDRGGQGGLDNGEGMKPYDPIIPSVHQDEKTIRFLFSYTCPHCRRYHNGLVQWGGTLPSPLLFKATPLLTSLNDDSQITAIFGRLIGEALDPKAVPYYDHLVYARLQGDQEAGIQKVDALKVEDILSMLVEAGIQASVIRSYVGNRINTQKIESKIPDHARIIKTFGVKVTPSVAIAGRYLVSPDHANGNAMQFLQLLNGLVSRVVEGIKNAT